MEKKFPSKIEISGGCFGGLEEEVWLPNHASKEWVYEKASLTTLPREVPTNIAVGVARPRAHGQETTCKRENKANGFLIYALNTFLSLENEGQFEV